MQEMSSRAREWIVSLSLCHHPEGGYFAEAYRADKFISQNALPDHLGARPFITSIYFMLPSGEVSHFHRLKSDEIWYHHVGGSLLIHQIDKQGVYRADKLGQDLADGDSLQIAISAGTWFGANVESGEEALVGCAVAPGFVFADFELATRQKMLAEFPQHERVISLLTRNTI